VGDPDIVVARMLEYYQLGIETFVLSGYPHLEEAYRVAELLFPRLPLYQPSSINSNYELQPFGEGFGSISNLNLLFLPVALKLDYFLSNWDI
jgi:hypothetical protein